MVLRRVGVLSAGKVMSILTALIYLIGGGLIALLSVMGAAIGNGGGAAEGGGVMAILFGVGAVVILPILGLILGFIWGIIYAALFNLTAKMVGGLHLELS